jgi:hypothetical protein
MQQQSEATEKLRQAKSKELNKKTEKALFTLWDDWTDIAEIVVCSRHGLKEWFQAYIMSDDFVSLEIKEKKDTFTAFCDMSYLLNETHSILAKHDSEHKEIWNKYEA